MPQLRLPGSGLLLWDWGCWEMMRERLLRWGINLWAESKGRDKVLQYLTEVSAIFMISLHTASYHRRRRRRVNRRRFHRARGSVSQSDGRKDGWVREGRNGRPVSNRGGKEELSINAREAGSGEKFQGRRMEE